VIAATFLAAMRDLPIHDIQALTGGSPPMVLAPHPDDEVLGCGGLIIQSLAAGLAPVVVIVTDGAASHPNSCKFPPAALSDLRAAEAREAVSRLGLPLCHLHFLACPDSVAPQEGPDFEVAVERIAALAGRAGCATIFASTRLDPHGDHLAVHVMATEACRRTGLRHLSYPVWAWTLPPDEELGDFTIAGGRLPVGRELEQKRYALDAHASQLGRIIDDDPEGFQLTPSVLDQFLRPFEVFLENP
jgi:LmbE family N-acetylglucosaminyl deacetylase